MIRTYRIADLPLFFLLFAAAPLDGSLRAQPSATTELTCSTSALNAFAPEKPVLLTGSEAKIPELRLQISTDVLPETIRIWYDWVWLEYPYPEHPFGVWSGADDIVDCTARGATNVRIPSYVVKPKGWYSGKYARSPKFDHLEIAFISKECGDPRIILSKREVQKFETMRALVSVPCGGVAKYKFEKY
jgi:hypothetical protein